MADTRERILPDVLRSIDSATFTGSYQVVGTPLNFQTRLIKFTNNSTVSVTLSWDGTHDADFLPAGSFLLLDVTSDAVPDSDLSIAAKTQFYAKGSAGTGLFYISSYYAT